MFIWSLKAKIWGCYMFLKQLELCNFRNYISLKLDFHEYTNIICGNNAQGKTNILEAIYFLGLTKSHRLSETSDLIQNGKEFATVSGILKSGEDTQNFFIGFDKSRKNLKIDNKIVKKVGEYVANINLILFCPDDLEILKGHPDVRRRFLNTEISQISASYFKILEEYNKLLKMRNDYLFNSSNSFDANYFSILTNYLVDRIISICKYRKNFIDKLNKNISSIYENITGLSDFSIRYIPNIMLDYHSNNVKEEIMNMYQNMENKEREAGKTLLGPHRDDFEFYLQEDNLKSYGSQGQQRVAVLSLKLAEISIFEEIKKTTPIILLDDVLSELDINKKSSLLKYIMDKMQVIITTTDINDIHKDIIKHANVIKIKEGKLEEVK